MEPIGCHCTAENVYILSFSCILIMWNEDVNRNDSWNKLRSSLVHFLEVLPPCTLIDLFRWVFFCSAVCRGMVRCEWKHWPNQPEPVSPVSVDLLVSGFPPVHLKPAVSRCTTRTGTCTSPVCPAALIHSTRTVTSTSVTSSFLQNKRSAYFLFLWPILFLITAVNDLHRLDKQREKLKHELMVKKMNCAIFTSGIKLAIFLRAA